VALSAQSVSTSHLENGPGSLASFFRDTGPSAKVVLGILLFFSLVSWLIIIAKYIRLARIRGQSNRFLDYFRKSKRFSEVNTMASQLADTPLTTLFKSGYAELDAQIKAARAEDPAAPTTGSARLLIKNISGIERALERAAGAEVSRLTRWLTFLATTASACPFIGLFGTVWGIMSAFNAIGASGSTSIVAVAPGISEALINTAAGLAAAIPALISYNYFMGQIRQMRALMDDFALEFLNLTERNFT
jgi:biopolymer transport protein TolQ